MGPPIFIGGRCAARICSRMSAPLASMGPPIFIGGRQFRGGPHREFLGELQWGRRFSSAEGARSRAGPPGLPPWLQWGRRFSSAEGSIARRFAFAFSQSFNGAADFHRRKAGVRSHAGGMVFRFNGAADFHRRKVPPRLPAPWLLLLASMGPPIFIGGRVEAAPAMERAFAASMGPPIFIGGRFTVIGNLANARQLQWGRRFSSAEGVVGLVVRARSVRGFNGAADFHRRKVMMSVTVSGGKYPASMGPPIFIGGRVGISSHADLRMAASMGPPIFIGGRLDCGGQPGR